MQFYSFVKNGRFRVSFSGRTGNSSPSVSGLVLQLTAVSTLAKRVTCRASLSGGIGFSGCSKGSTRCPVLDTGRSWICRECLATLLHWLVTAPTTVPRGRPGPAPWFQTRPTSVRVSVGGRRRGLCGLSCRVSLQSFPCALGRGWGAGNSHPAGLLTDSPPPLPFPDQSILSHHRPDSHPGWDYNYSEVTAGTLLNLATNTCPNREAR